MYRSERQLEIADIKIRLFVEYCNELQSIRDEIFDISRLMRDRTARSKSVIKLKDQYMIDDPLLDLIEQRDKLVELYKTRIIFIRPIGKYLQTLSEFEVQLLSDRYEKNMTLRQLGERYHYSYMNISRYLDSILEKCPR